MCFLETSALDSTNVEQAFTNVVEGKCVHFLRYTWLRIGLNFSSNASMLQVIADCSAVGETGEKFAVALQLCVRLLARLRSSFTREAHCCNASQRDATELSEFTKRRNATSDFMQDPAVLASKLFNTGRCGNKASGAAKREVQL